MNLKRDPGNGVFFVLLFLHTTLKGDCMIKVNPGSINDLLALKEAGLPVTMTSHPGNASLYKLVLWSCGIPEHLWDVTCCKADANNWPMYRLIDGRAELLIAEDLHRKIMTVTDTEKRFVTAYQFTVDGKRLGRTHVKAMQECFPDVISSCSRLLLSEKEKIWEVFDYLARTKEDEVFGRYITSDGVLKPIVRSGLYTAKLADSFINLLEELDHLLFSDKDIATKGGACYDGVMVPLSTMLVQYWQTGRVDRYDVSGPDMIHYATRPEHQDKLSEMLRHLHRWNPRLIPKNILIQMFPGTVARVGYVPNHISEEIMKRKVYALRNHNSFDKSFKRILWDSAREDEKTWPIQIRPSVDHYFSQYDLLYHGGKLVVDDFWMELPIASIKETLQRANAFLRL